MFNEDIERLDIFFNTKVSKLKSLLKINSTTLFDHEKIYKAFLKNCAKIVILKSTNGGIFAGCFSHENILLKKEIEPFVHEKDKWDLPERLK